MLGSLANGINADNRRNEEEIVEEQSIIPAVAAQGSKNAQSPKATQHVSAMEIENAVEGIDERCFGKLISSSKANAHKMLAEIPRQKDANITKIRNSKLETKASDGEKGDVPKHSGEQKFQQNVEMEEVAEFSKGLGPWMPVQQRKRRNAMPPQQRNMQDRRQMNMQRAGRPSGNQQSYTSNKSRSWSTSRGRRVEWIPKKTSRK
ncbi:hypothetical protein HPP92_012829 [Vanilla planifolia]|uniref:Uncharacterized protein n=1 Tax=Vanilla planifolia TaxID=51239 RepID=A0A835QXT6_VANPL|nr:hypothetical protein HPP92_012829 [Vanilla planifolia]